MDPKVEHEAPSVAGEQRADAARSICQAQAAQPGAGAQAGVPQHTQGTLATMRQVAMRPGGAIRYRGPPVSQYICRICQMLQQVPLWVPCIVAFVTYSILSVLRIDRNREEIDLEAGLAGPDHLASSEVEMGPRANQTHNSTSERQKCPAGSGARPKGRSSCPDSVVRTSYLRPQ